MDRTEQIADAKSIRQSGVGIHEGARVETGDPSRLPAGPGHRRDAETPSGGVMLPWPVDRSSREVFLARCADVAGEGPAPVIEGPDHDTVAQAIEDFRERGGVILRLKDGKEK